MGSGESKPEKAEWSEYQNAKAKAHELEGAGDKAFKNKNFDYAYALYCQAYEKRSQCDYLWAKMKGGGHANVGHAHWSKGLVQKRDKADEKRNGTSLWGRG